MDVDVPAILRKMLEIVPGKQAGLAERLSWKGRNGRKIDQPQISRWLKGQQPERKSYDRIVEVATELGVLTDMRSEDVAASLPDDRARTVKLKGYVGASGEAFFYRLASDDLEEVKAPEYATDQTVAVEVRGKSLGALLEGWLVFYDDVRSPVTEDLIGALCVVGLADDRIVVKRIERDDRGRWRLVSNTPGEDAIENAQIEWAAEAKGMRPARHS